MNVKKGDSGGPYMFMNETIGRWQLNGIISKGGETCGARMQPGFYTFVPRFLRWIHHLASFDPDSSLFVS